MTLTELILNCSKYRVEFITIISGCVLMKADRLFRFLKEQLLIGISCCPPPSYLISCISTHDLFLIFTESIFAALNETNKRNDETA